MGTVALRTVGVLGVAAVALAFAAYWGGPTTRSAAGTAGQPAELPESDLERGASAAPSRATGQSSRGDLPAGTYKVWGTPGAVYLRANQAPSAEVLDRVAGVARVTLTTHAPVEGAVTADLGPSSLERIVQELVQGLPFIVGYRLDPVSGAHLAASLAVGDPEPVQGCAVAEGIEQPEFPVAYRDEAVPAGDDAPSLLPRQQREHERYLNALALRLADGEAHSGFAPNAPSSQRLLQLLQSDPNVQVREAAAYLLAGAPTDEARQALLGALEDVSAPVVARALRSLGQLRDPQLIPRMRAAAGESNDPAVLAALGEAEAQARSAPAVSTEGSVIVVRGE